MTDEALTDEYAVYESRVAEWVEGHLNDFVLIKGTEVVGFYTTYEEALSSGYERFGVAPFLVKQVGPQPEAHYISRLVAPTPLT